MSDETTYKELERKIKELENVAAEHERMKQALQKSEERYRLLAENVTDVIWAMDENLNLTYISPSIQRLSGFTPEEAMKQSPLDQLTPSSLELAYKTFSEHFQALGNSPDEQARPVKMELEDTRKDGSTGWSEINTTFLRSPEGSFSGIVGVSRDITERKRLEEELKRYRDHLEELVAQSTDELRKSNEEFQREITQRKRAEKALREERDFSTSLIQTSPTFFVALSPELKTVMMNDAMLKELGYEKAEALGTNYLDTFVPKSDHELLVRSFEDLVGSKEPVLIESHVLTKDGRKLLVEWHGRQLLKESGEIDSFFGVGIEITERKKTEKALRESEERYRSLVENIDLGITQISQDYKIVMTNAAVGKFLERPKCEFVGKNCFEEFEKRDAACSHCPGAEAMATGRAAETETEGVLDEGRRVPVRIQAFPLMNQKGTPEGFIEVVEDITERKVAEEALRQSEERFRALFEGSLDAILLIDPESGRIQDANPATSELLLRSYEEIVGLPFTALFPPHLEKLSKELFAWYLQDEGQEHPVETYVLRPDSSEIQVEILAQIIQTRGTPILHSVFRDITERKRAEQALREGERFLSDIFVSIQDGISILDDTLSIIRVNPTIERWYSHTMPLVGKKCYEAYHERNEPCEVCPTRQTLDTAESAYEVVPKTGPGGKIAGWLDLYSFPLLDSQTGQLKGVIEYVRDITARKLAEDKLRESEERYERAEEIGHFGHWDGDFIEGHSVWSKETYRIFGMDPAKFKPTYKAFLDFVHPEDRERLKTAVQLVMRKGGEIDLEYRIIRPDGEVRFIHSIAEIHLDKNGKPWKSIGMLHDITEHRRMEQEIAKVQQLESLGILAGGIAHDFNNILTAILANISMARLYGGLQDDISQMLTDAEKASLRAKKLTQQLLTFAKGGAPIRKVMSIPGLLKDTAEFSLSGSKVSCEFSMPDDLWPIEADAGQVSQVIQNLIINADQAMPRGGTIKICAENAVIGENYVPPLKEGRYLKISITDQGTGIAKKDLQNIFDPFFTTKQKGSGLGLATAFSIVNNHEGHICVDSEVEVGSTFHVYLPACSKTPKPEERAKDKLTRGKARILLIDDEEMIRRAAGEVLERIGYQVTVSKDHAEGIRLYEKALKGKHPFDAIIMDLTIPGDMGAREAIKKLKKIDRNAKVIVSSGYSDDPTMSNYREYGFRGVVQKPYEIDDLAEVIDMVLGRA